LWPECWMVCGSPRHSPSNGGVERVSRTMQEKLGARMKDCKSRQWMIGCCLMIWQYNTQNHCTIGNIPYHLVFGQLPRVGISVLPLDASVLTQLATEAHLNRVCNYVGKVDVLVNETAVVEAIDNAEEDKTADCDQIQGNTNNSNNQEYVTAVDNYDVNGSGVADDNLDEIAVELLHTMDVEENCAQVGNFDEENIPLVTVVMDYKPSTTRKLNCLEEISRWHESVKDIPNDVQINHAYLGGLKLGESAPVAWCVQNHDVHHLELFVPAFLTRITAHLWEITDEDDLEMAQLDWDGDKGVENLIGISIQHPSQNFINYFQTHPSTAALSSTMSRDQHEASPHRARLRKLAARKLESRTKSMKAVAMKKGVGKVFELGEVILVPLANVDKAKVDSQNLNGVIVKINTNRMLVRVVVKSGLLKQWYSYHKLTHVVGKGNNIELLGLQEAYPRWGLMKVISEWEASRNEPLVGGQGKGDVTCNCKSACDSNRCSCFRAGRICTSACHRNNAKCKNHDRDNL
jgi:hypothetical protein